MMASTADGREFPVSVAAPAQTGGLIAMVATAAAAIAFFARKAMSASAPAPVAMYTATAHKKGDSWKSCTGVFCLGWFLDIRVMVCRRWGAASCYRDPSLVILVLGHYQSLGKAGYAHRCIHPSGVHSLGKPEGVAVTIYGTEPRFSFWLDTFWFVCLVGVNTPVGTFFCPTRIPVARDPENRHYQDVESFHVVVRLFWCPFSNNGLTFCCLRNGNLTRIPFIS